MLTFSSHFKDIAPSKEAQDRLFNAILQERQMQKSGYYNLPYDNQALEEAYQYVRQNEAFLDTIAHLVIIGVGGSSLGLKAIDSMLRHLPCRKKLDLIFLEHTDPLHITQSLEHISIQNALFIVISKSGTTIESISLLKYMLDRYEILQNAQNKAHLFVITDNRSPLESWAKQYNLHCFHIPL